MELKNFICILTHEIMFLMGFAPVKIKLFLPNSCFRKKSRIGEGWSMIAPIFPARSSEIHYQSIFPSVILNLCNTVALAEMFYAFVRILEKKILYLGFTQYSFVVSASKF